MNFKKNVSVLAAIALMASSLVGCSDDPNVIATVGSSKITTEMLQKEVDLTRLMYEDTIKKSEYKNLVEDTLEAMIQVEVLYQKGVANNIETTDEKIEESVNYLKSNLAVDNIDESLKAIGYSEEDLKLSSEKNLIAYDYLEDLQGEQEVSINYAKEVYEDIKEENYSYQYFNADHILIKTVDDNYNPLSDEEIAKRKEKATAILNYAKKGSDFAELAKKYSEDTGSKENGGALGEFAEGEMVSEFEEACAKLEKGKMTQELVETAYGFHIIKLNDKGTKYESFEDLQSTVLYDAINTKTTEALDKLVDENSKTNDSVLEEFIKNLGPLKTPTKDTTEDKNTTETNSQTTNNNSSNTNANNNSSNTNANNN